MFPFVTVIGTIFMDCKGFARQHYNPHGRNLGSIEFVHGGVGRNVAENLARLDVPVALASSVDSTGVGHDIVSRLERAGVRTEYLLRVEQRGMGMWLAILDENGDLAGSISQMPDLDLLRDLLYTRGKEIVEHSSHIALEIDLSEELSRKVIELAKKYHRPIFGIPGNFDVIMNHPDLLRDMDCFICNEIEGSTLLGRNISGLRTESLIEHLRNYVRSSGLRSMVITLGEQGAVYYDARTEMAGHQTVFPVNVVDTTGAGDAFFSGTVMGLVRGLSLRDAVICGTKVAGWTIESPENNCPDLAERVRRDQLLMELLRQS